MKVYLAGAMNGVPERNHPTFNNYAAILRDQGHEVFSPAELTDDSSISGRPERDALAVELWWICQEADAIALIPGWETSKGANVEWRLGIALGLKFIYLDGGND